MGGLTVTDGTFCTTSHRAQTNSPVWNQCCSAPVLARDTVRFDVYNKDDLGADDQQKVLAELSDLIWQNRDGASRATRRIATLVLQQAAGRLQA